jgi:hypothetical protein
MHDGRELWGRVALVWDEGCEVKPWGSSESITIVAGAIERIEPHVLDRMTHRVLAAKQRRGDGDA